MRKYDLGWGNYEQKDEANCAEWVKIIQLEISVYGDQGWYSSFEPHIKE